MISDWGNILAAFPMSLVSEWGRGKVDDIIEEVISQAINDILHGNHPNWFILFIHYWYMPVPSGNHFI